MKISFSSGNHTLNIYSEQWSGKVKNESWFKLSFYTHGENLHIHVERNSFIKWEKKPKL